MAPEILSLEETAREVVSQVLTAKGWTPSRVSMRLKQRPDGQLFTASQVTAFAQKGTFAQALTQVLARAPQILRELVSPELVRSWSALVAHNVKVLEAEIEGLETALGEAAVGRVRLSEVLLLAAKELRDAAAHLDQEILAQQQRYTQVQREHLESVKDLQTSRVGAWAFFMRLFKGEVLTRLVQTSNERVALAYDLEVNQAAARLLARAAEGAQQRAGVVAARVAELGHTEETGRIELAGLEMRLQSRAPFLTKRADNWTILQAWHTAHDHYDGQMPPGLVGQLIDGTTNVEEPVKLIEATARARAAEEAAGLNVVSALETEAKQLGIAPGEEQEHPLVVVGEAIVKECLEERPRFGLNAVAKPREFPFLVVPNATMALEVTGAQVAEWSAGSETAGYVGFVHVQLGLAREDLEVYGQVRERFEATQKHHNLFVIEELAKQWQRRGQRR